MDLNRRTPGRGQLAAKELATSCVEVLAHRFLPFMAESQQSHPSQQFPPVSPMDIKIAQKK
jgi:hypothetical protein